MATVNGATGRSATASLRHDKQRCLTRPSLLAHARAGRHEQTPWPRSSDAAARRTTVSDPDVALLSSPKLSAAARPNRASRATIAFGESKKHVSRGRAGRPELSAKAASELLAAWARKRLRLTPGRRSPTSHYPRKAGRSPNRGKTRRGARAGLRVGHPTQLFCIRLAIEAFADGQPSLVLLVRSRSAVAVAL
jgi:hypothetical protein